MKSITVVYFLLLSILSVNEVIAQKAKHTIPAPLYRDPITDGAADPVLIWNRQEKKWWMLYTQRRANLEAPDVAYCYGNDIAIASGEDSGQTWVYRGTLKLDIEKGRNTFWAPDVVYENGVYHMFVAYIQGVRVHWGGDKRLAHYTSKNLWDWKFEGFLKLSSGMVIDPSLIKMPDGNWRMWYKDEINHSHLMLAESKDLFHWKQYPEPVLGNTAQEGPKIFNFDGFYWMLTDEWRGMRVYRSADASHWEKQGLILDSASQRKEDGPSGAHGDVIVVNNKAWIFYFTHPGRAKHTETHEGENGIVPFDERRSSIQGAALKVENGTLVCDRSDSVDFLLEEPRH